MFQCNNCNHKFEEPNVNHTSYEALYGVSSLFDSSTHYDQQVCPRCGDDDFDELMQCDFCENWVREEDLTEVGLSDTLIWACPKCAEIYDKED